MSSNPFFLISILLSSIIAFASVAFIVEMSLILLQRYAKFNNGRTRALLRCLPFVSLSIDLLFNAFSIGYLFNPLNCQSCVQKLILFLFFPDLKSYLYSHEISLLEHLGEATSHAIFTGISIIFIALTLFFVLRKVIEAVFVRKMLQSMLRDGIRCSRQIENTFLIKALQKNGVRIYVSHEIDIPMATHSNIIFIPKIVESHFSQEEFEAIVAHELEHILWKDPHVRFFSQLITAIFWWVPTYEFRKKLEFEQEVACDQSINRYRIQENSLASALVKITTHAKKKTYEVFCYFIKKKHILLQRLEALLNIKSKSSKYHEWMSFFVVILASLIILFCALWP